MMCSTIAGANCGIFGAMGLKTRYWDISMHTVMDVEYDGRFHMFDNSLTALYTLCDGKTLADVTEIGAEGACEASGGKKEPGHIARYHCLTATSKNGFLTGCDTMRSVAEEYRCFNPNGLKYRYYLMEWNLGHRYILNLRPNEVYTRYYYRLDADSPDAVAQNDQGENASYKADPAYYTPNPAPEGKDPESPNPRYHIRGNGVRTYAPSLANADLAGSVISMAGLKAIAPAGLEPAQAGQGGEAVFRVEGANVITSLKIAADFVRKGQDDASAISISTNNGLAWKEVWKNDKTGDGKCDLKLIGEVNGSYEVLVKVSLMGKAAASDAQLKAIRFDTITQVNGKTQPTLKLGKNTVYVGSGEQTQSIVYWPDLQGDKYKPYVVEEKNVKTADKHPGYMGTMFADQAGQEAYVVFKMDAPADITRITYGGRFYNRCRDAHIDMLHSFDGGKTWTPSYSLTDTTSPWDVIHYEKVDNVPPGTKSVLFKYLWNGYGAGCDACSIYAVRMEANYKPADTTAKPMEVTFTWDEPQKEYGQFVTRSHTQLVEKTPFTYTINVGGEDHPVVKSLQVNLKGARAAAVGQPAEVKYGYSDGKDVGGDKFVYKWVTYGKILSEGKPYTSTVPSGDNWGAGDPDGKKLTDGVVGPPASGGTSYGWGAIYGPGKNPEIVIDLGEVLKCGAFRIDVGGYDWWDAIKGQIKDKAEVLVSNDDKEYTSVGMFDFNLRWKDIPINHAWNDDETFTGHNFALIPPKPVSARYVKYKLTPARNMSVSELQVLDFIKFEPFDIKLSGPDGKDRSDITQYPLRHDPSQPYKPKKAAADE